MAPTEESAEACEELPKSDKEETRAKGVMSEETAGKDDVMLSLDEVGRFIKAFTAVYNTSKHNSS